MRQLFLLPLFAFFAAPAFAQQPSAPPAQPVEGEFFIHAYHKDKLGGTLDCSMCHVADKPGSVTMKRPGHDQCMTCHGDAFDKTPNPKICNQCHTEYPPTGPDTLVPFPRYKGSRTILFEFSHKQHTDPKARLDARTGFRSDCTFCHKFDTKGQFATFPGHQQCTTCHSKAGMKPQLTAELNGDTCRGCHTPEEIENPGFTEARRFTGSHTTASGQYVNIKFDHSPHFKAKDQFSLRCTTCHYEIPNSTSISNLSLPKMIDCVECHDSARAVKADFRMSKCSVCHADPTQSQAIPNSHTVNVKPEFHTEAFRTQHAEQSSEPNAKCFVCHQNVSPSVSGKAECDSCHQVMLPKNHTARWKDDLHGKYAALDRTSCATCHTAAYCSDCHNELPRSHNPLPLYKAGSHAFSARLDLRSCFTCHTFKNTCAECHVNSIAALQVPGQAVLAMAEPPKADSALSQRGMIDLSPFFGGAR